MADRVYLTLEGSREVKDRLLAMSEAASGPVIIPIVADVASKAGALMAALAPRLTGALSRGINPNFLKAGPGYCHFTIALSPDVYYGLFQEFGLGDKATRGPSARTQRRRANYDATTALQRAGKLSTDIEFRKRNGKLSQQGKRLQALERGRSIQGKRRPNMAAQPFIRPVLFGNRASLTVEMLERIASQILEQTTSEGRA